MGIEGRTEAMLRSVKGVTGYVLKATDGEIGRARDFLFDDEHWTLRYLVADTGKWLPGRKVLVSPISLGDADWSSGLLTVRLTKSQIEEAPALDEHAPVSRQFEKEYHEHYGWPLYWAGAGVWGTSAYPMPLYDTGKLEGEEGKSESGDPHLRSADEVTGYHIEAQDGEIGHVEDFILEDDTWTIRYIVVDTRNWLPGKKVLLSPTWIESIDWGERKVHVAVEREAIKDSPEYDPSAPVNRDYEGLLHDFYGRPKYWETRRSPDCGT